MKHVPVLLGEALELLNVKKDGLYLDVTGGMGGHSEAIRERLTDSGQLVVSDYHEPSIVLLKKRFSGAKNVRVLHERFSLIFDNLDLPSLYDGILADFGISSWQLEENTGIAFLQENVPLDMRLDARFTRTATDILEAVSENELADIFFHLGGERHARHLARIIVHDRATGKIPQTTTDLRQLCERTLGRFYRGKKIHPATKVFQALRIAVNGELEEIRKFLERAPERLCVGGRLVVISFHEGEDRLVKTVFRELAATDRFRLPVRKSIKPSADEVCENPRARSARLRILEKCGT